VIPDQGFVTAFGPSRTELNGVFSFGHSNGEMIGSYGQSKGTSAWS
jgi:hypothetical protein